MEKIQKKGIFWIGVALFMLLLTICESQKMTKYAITDSRTASFRESCGGISKSSLNIIKDEKTDAIQGFLRGYFNINGAKVISGYLSGNEDESKNQIKTHFGPIFMLVFPFAIGALATALVWPCLLCCCMSRPQCCRTLKFWQRDQSEWTKTELSVPLALSLILVVGLFVISIIGFVKMSEVKTSYDHSLCARAVVFDDLLNGNFNEDTDQYFIGLQTFENNLHNFLDNFDSLTQSFETVTSSSGPMKKITGKLGEVVTQLVNLPAGNGKELNLVYGSPLNAKKPTKTIRSIFPSALGSVDQPSSLIGVAYKEINDVKKDIDKIGEISDFYLNTSGPSTSQIGIIQNQLQNTINQVYQVDKNMQDKAKQFQSKPYWITVGSFVAFSLLIVFSIVSFISLIFVGVKKKMVFRYVLYVSIFILVALTGLSFALAISSAIGVPIGLFTCDFIDSSAANSQNFQENFKFLLGDKSRMAISQCVPSARGVMLNKLSNDLLIKSFASLPEAVKAMTRTDYAQKTSSILEKFNNVKKQVSNVMNAYKLDIADPAAIQLLTKLSQSYKYDCTANQFHEDSWIPSIQQNPQKIPCKFGIGAVADHTTCTMGDQFQQRAQGCVGCMDTYGIFKFTDSVNAVNNALTLRYKGSGCQPFIDDLSNVWNNYYRIKKTMLEPLISRHQAAKTTIQIGTDTLIKDIQPLFGEVVQTLEGISPKLVDPKYGIGAGLNCNIIGSDLQLFRDNVCRSLLPRIYVMLIIFGVLSFALLFTICFMSCTVSRHFNHYIKTEANGEQVNEESGGKTQKQTDSKDQKTEEKNLKNDRANRRSRERSKRASRLSTLNQIQSQEELCPKTEDPISKQKM